MISPETALALRQPFPPESVGKLPKPIKARDDDRGRCEQGSRYSADGHYCGGWHSRSVHLDFVGHAAVTDRLLAIDPEWSWEPMATGQDGLPAFDANGNLWIKLTIKGTTRLGVGDGPSIKERIGDAIRNAAMRFGVALDLWARQDLVEFERAVVEHRVGGGVSASDFVKAEQPAERPPEEPAGPAAESGADAPKSVTAGQLKALHTVFSVIGLEDRGARLEYASRLVGRSLTSSKELTQREARMVIDAAKADEADQ